MVLQFYGGAEGGTVHIHHNVVALCTQPTNHYVVATDYHYGFPTMNILQIKYGFGFLSQVLTFLFYLQVGILVASMVTIASLVITVE